MRQSELTDFGRAIASLEDRAIKKRLDRVSGRARLLEAPDSPSRAVRGLGARAVAAALVAGVMGVMGARAMRAREPLGFEVAGERGSIGAWIAAPETAARDLLFSDGSKLELGAGSRARVMALDADGADVALENGSLEVSTVHREHTDWKVRGGPFVVYVTGAEFRMSWYPKTEEFDVASIEGAVLLSGPVVGEPRVIHRGQELHVTRTSMSIRTGLAGPRVYPSGEAPVSRRTLGCAGCAPENPGAGSENGKRIIR